MHTTIGLLLLSPVAEIKVTVWSVTATATATAWTIPCTGPFCWARTGTHTGHLNSKNLWCGIIPRSPGQFLGSKVCHGYFVLLNVTRYWGIVTVPGSPRVNRPQIIIWVGRILTLHLNYVAGYPGPLLFLFERTHNYYVDNQGLVPWRLRRLGRSKVCSASLVKVLSDGKISCHGE